MSYQGSAKKERRNYLNTRDRWEYRDQTHMKKIKTSSSTASLYKRGMYDRRPKNFRNFNRSSKKEKNYTNWDQNRMKKSMSFAERERQSKKEKREKKRFIPEQPVYRKKFDLDIYSKKRQIIESCTNQKQRVVIICGDTGCGKSTQVPQFLYEYYQHQRKLGSTQNYKMLCTQPRRIACMSIVKRIAQEMNINVGDKIGYHISRDFKKVKRTDILFVTNGMFLNYLTNDPMCLEEYSHVLIDEVHERDLDADLILIIIKSVIKKFPNLTLILMSATINSDFFAEYFSKASIDEVTAQKIDVIKVAEAAEKMREDNTDYFNNGRHKDDDSDDDEDNNWDNYDYTQHTLVDTWGAGPTQEDIDRQKKELEENRIKVKQEKKRRKDMRDTAAKVIKIESKTAFGIDYYYLDQIAYDLYETQVGKRTIDRKSLEKLGDFNWHGRKGQLIIEAVKVACSMIAFIHASRDSPEGMGHPDGKPGTVLVFLPGLNEIYVFIEILSQIINEELFKELNVIPLHSTLADTNEDEIFKTAPDDNRRKVIVSTNIAESSLTIPYVNYIIDFCLGKQLAFDQKTGIHKLDLCWSSKASCRQRAGRTGRVCSGHVFRMVTKKFYETLPEYATAEILRCPLDKVILKICNLLKKMKISVEHELEILQSRKIQVKNRKFGKAQLMPKGLLSSTHPDSPFNPVNRFKFTQYEEMTSEDIERKMIMKKEIMAIFSSPAQVLARALEIPKPDQMLYSLKTLEENGAFIIRDEKELNGEITYFGEFYSELPSTIEITKLLVYGHYMGCYNDALSIAAFMSYPKSIFKPKSNKHPIQDRDLKFMKRLERWSDRSHKKASDHMIYIKLFEEWKNEYLMTRYEQNAHRETNLNQKIKDLKRKKSKKSRKEERGFSIQRRYARTLKPRRKNRFATTKYFKEWEKDNFLRERVMIEIYANYRDLNKRMRMLLNNQPNTYTKGITPEERYLKLMVCICAAMLPNMMEAEYKLSDQQKRDQQNMVRNMEMDSHRIAVLSHTHLNQFFKVEEEFDYVKEEEKFPLRQVYSNMQKNIIIKHWKEQLAKHCAKRFGPVSNIKYEFGEFFIEFESELAYKSLKTFVYTLKSSEYQNKMRVFSIEQGSMTKDVHEEYWVKEKKLNFDDREDIQNDAKVMKRHEKNLASHIDRCLNHGLGSLNYMHQPRVFGVYTGCEISMMRESFNNVMVSPKIQRQAEGHKKLLLIASSMQVNSASRVIAKMVSILPNLPMFGAYVTMIFGNNVGLIYDQNHQRIEGYRYMATDIKFNNWVEEQDISKINKQRFKIRKFFTSGLENLDPDQVWAEIKEIIIDIAKSREKMIHPDKWFHHFKEQAGLVVNNNANMYGNLFDENLGMIFQDEEENKEEIKFREDAMAHMKAKLGVNFMLPMFFESADMIIDTNAQKDNCNYYLTWKREKLKELKKTKDMAYQHYSKVCCRECGQHICRVEDLRDGVEKNYLVQIISNSRPPLIRMIEGKEELHLFKNEPQNKIILHILEKYGEDIDVKNASFYTCFKGHFCAISLEGYPHTYLITNAKFKLMEPDLLERNFDLSKMDLQQLIETQTQKQLKKKRKFAEGWICPICSPIPSDDVGLIKDKHGNVIEKEDDKNQRAHYNAEEITLHINSETHKKLVLQFTEDIDDINGLDYLADEEQVNDVG